MKLLTVSEVATRLHKGEATISRWLREGKLPHIQISERRRLVKEFDLQRFLDARTVVPPEKMVDSIKTIDLNNLENSSLTTEYPRKGVRSHSDWRKEIERQWQ